MTNTFILLQGSAACIHENLYHIAMDLLRIHKTMISVTDNYSPKYQKFVTALKALQPPKQFQNAIDLYIKSLESELQGNLHFRNYLSTNSSTETNLSSEFLSNASDYKTEAFEKLRSAGLFSTVP